MSPTGLLMIVIGVWVISRLVTKDSTGETLAGRLVGGQPSSASNSSTSTAAGSTSTSTASIPTATGSTAVAIGQVTYGQLNTLAKLKGWTSQEVSDWIQVIADESGGNPTAQNPTSSAYGIAQGITGPSWYAAHGGNANTVMGQLTAMANYIASTYGSPSAALAHENAQHWY